MGIWHWALGIGHWATAMGVATMGVGQWAFDLGEHGGRLAAVQPVEHRERVG